MGFGEEISQPCAEGRGVTIDDFRAYMPTHTYIFMHADRFYRRARNCNCAHKIGVFCLA